MAKPPAAKHEELIARLSDLSTVLAQARATIPLVNDAAFGTDLSAKTVQFISAAEDMVALHQAGPKVRSVAGHLAAINGDMRSLIRLLPPPDLSMGSSTHLPGMELLRARISLVSIAIEAANEAALRQGMKPKADTQAATVPRAGLEGVVRGLTKRLDETQKRLDALEQAPKPQVAVQQNGWVNIAFPAYFKQMKVEISFAKLRLALSSRIDLGALTGSIERMGALTEELWHGLRTLLEEAWSALRGSADAVRTLLGKVRRGAAAIGKWVLRGGRVGGEPVAVAGGLNASLPRPTGSVAATAEPPPEFSQAAAEAMILAGRRPPEAWRRHITLLGFGTFPVGLDGGVEYGTPREKFETGIDLRLLADLPRLLVLALDGMAVTELAPLGGLASLQELWLRGTQVSDLAPLGRLRSLQKLRLDRTLVSDLAPLGGLASLQTLWLDGTQVSDLAPLGDLASLQTLSLNHTQVSDLAPLSGLAGLQTLWLTGTQVSDLAPLGDLAGLQELSLSGTQVSDLAPLSGLAGLQTLWLNRTRVSEAGVVAFEAARGRLGLGKVQIFR